jgi:acyl-CoA dehydrogenase
MTWDFSTEPEFGAQLDWVREFVREEILPLEAIAPRWRGPGGQAALAAVCAPLKEQVRRRGLWAAHLPAELGGGGWGQVPLALLHEILGATPLAPPIFGVIRVLPGAGRDLLSWRELPVDTAKARPSSG